MSFRLRAQQKKTDHFVSGLEPSEEMMTDRKSRQKWVGDRGALRSIATPKEEQNDNVANSTSPANNKNISCRNVLLIMRTISELYVEHGGLTIVPTMILQIPIKTSCNTSLWDVGEETKILQKLTVDDTKDESDILKKER